MWSAVSGEPGGPDRVAELSPLSEAPGEEGVLLMSGMVAREAETDVLGGGDAILTVAVIVFWGSWCVLWRSERAESKPRGE